MGQTESDLKVAVEDGSEGARIGPIGRLVGTLLSPGETFADVNRRPTWLVPAVLSMALAIGFGLFFEWRVKPDWDRVFRSQMRQRVEATGGQMPSEEDIQKQVNVAKSFVRYGWILSGAAPLVFTLVLAGIFALALMMLQAQTTFVKVWSVVLWSNLATTLLYILVAAASLMLKDANSLRDIDPTNPAGVAATSLAALLSSDAGPVLNALARQFDVFTIWFLVLVSIGFAAVSGSKRITSRSTGQVVFGLWVVWLLVRAGWAALLGT